MLPSVIKTECSQKEPTTNLILYIILAMCVISVRLFPTNWTSVVIYMYIINNINNIHVLMGRVAQTV